MDFLKAEFDKILVAVVLVVMLLIFTRSTDAKVVDFLHDAILVVLGLLSALIRGGSSAQRLPGNGSDTPAPAVK